MEDKLTRSQMKTLTRQQIAGVRRIVRYAREMDRRAPGVKPLSIMSFRITTIGDKRCWKVAVFIRVGRREWEGTLAEVLCQRFGHFFVGRRGGITTTTGTASKEKREKHPLIYGMES